MDNATNLVIIEKAEYAELLGKAYAYDAYARVVTNTINNGGYVSDTERAFFYKEEPKGIPDEEWAKIEALMEEQEEDDAEEL